MCGRSGSAGRPLTNLRHGSETHESGSAETESGSVSAEPGAAIPRSGEGGIWLGPTLARLKPGVTIAQVEAEGTMVARSIPRPAVVKCRVKLDRLRDLGYELRRPEADYLRDGIYELRLRVQRVNYRMLYFFHGNTAAVVCHGILKEKVIPPKEIDRAVKRPESKVVPSPTPRQPDRVIDYPMIDAGRTRRRHAAPRVRSRHAHERVQALS